MAPNRGFPKGEEEFNKWLVTEYFRHGSVDEVLKFHRYSIPVSYANYQRVLDKWGVVKAVGPNKKMADIVEFLTYFVEKKIPLELLYKKMPPSFKPSAATLYRVMSYIKEGITRRLATGLIITPRSDKKKVLVACDISTPRVELGKPYGSVTIPMGFSKIGDPRENAILRVLQQEVFTDKAITNNIPEVIPARPKPFMYLDIADVRVEVFNITLPKKFTTINQFSSFKLKGYKFLDISEKTIYKHANFRVGVAEAIVGYKKYLEYKKRNLTFNPLQYKSRINYRLASDTVYFGDSEL
jgi:hypothetical protein